MMAPCPQCRRPASNGSDNPHRPFCSERCQHLDLAAWLDGDYVIAEPLPPVPGGEHPDAPADDER
jgi:endogenous inhibitor of DNA gyrase (YacG/DUF329 family)